MEDKTMISALLTGAIIGWLAGGIMGTGKKSWLKNILVGVLGSSLGTFLFGILGFSAHGLFAELIVSVVGACVFIWLIGRLF